MKVNTGVDHGSLSCVCRSAQERKVQYKFSFLWSEKIGVYIYCVIK